MDGTGPPGSYASETQGLLNQEVTYSNKTKISNQTKNLFHVVYTI